MDLIYHNTTTKRYFQLKNKKFQSVDKGQHTYTSLPINAMKVELVNIPNENISEQDLRGVLLSRAYDYLNVDKNKKYIIKYLKNSFGYNLFMLDKSYINTDNYEYLTYEPLCYTTLYDNHLIAYDTNTCFVKLKTEGSFMAIYNGKHFVKAISLDEYIIKNMHTKYDLDYIKELLRKYDDNGAKIVSSSLSCLKAVIEEELLAIKERFAIEMDNMFIDFDTTIDSQYVQVLKKDIDKRIEPFSIDPLGSDSSTVVLTSMLVKNHNHILNFKVTHIANNQNFLQKSVASVIVASAISLSYPVYLAYQTVMTKIETININNTTKKISDDKKQLLASVQQYLEYKKQLDTRLATMKKEKKEIISDLDDIRHKVDNKKSEILVKLTNKLHITDVTIENISLREKNGNNIVSLSLLSPKESRIKYVIDELASFDVYKNSIYRYNKNFRANIEVIL